MTCLAFCATLPECLAFRIPLRLQKPMSENVHHKPDRPPAFDGSALLARVGRSRDRDAFVELFNYYAPRVKSYLLRHGADDSAAEEIVQSTFITVWEKAKAYDPKKAAASTWIFTIARNKRIDALRKDRLVTFDSDSPVMAAAVAAEDNISGAYTDGLDAAGLDAAIDALPEDQAKILRMAFFEDKSHSAIAKETRLPLGTVKSRLRLALGKLRAALKREET
jgi:RNA polymerase sigma-70 factor (ECF subfamily)